MASCKLSERCRFGCMLHGADSKAGASQGLLLEPEETGIPQILFKGMPLVTSGLLTRPHLLHVTQPSQYYHPRPQASNHSGPLGDTNHAQAIILHK